MPYKSRGCPPKAICGQFVRFLRLRDLMANICSAKVTQTIGQRAGKYEASRGLIQSSSEISWTLVHKWVKMGPEFSPNLRKFSILLCCQALHTENRAQPNFAKREEVNGADASWMRWRRIVNAHETIEIRSLVFWSPNNQLKLAVAQDSLSRMSFYHSRKQIYQQSNKMASILDFGR